MFFIINYIGVYLLSDTTICGYIYIYIYIYIIYYIEKNYRFRRMIMAIFRLYMKHLVSSYTKHVYGLLIWGREGVKKARDLVSVLKVGWCGLHSGSMLLPSYV